MQLWSSPLSGLRAVPNRRNRDPVRSYSVADHVRSASDHQFPHSRLAARTTQVRMFFQSFDQRNNPRRQLRGSVRLVFGYVISYLFQPRQCPRRPENL